MMVKSPNPKLSNIKRVTWNFFSMDLKIIAKIAVLKIKVHIQKSCIQNTGTSSNKSLTVPPPTAVTKAIISTPKGSSLFCMAAKLPDIAKDTVPRTSMMKLKF